MDGVNVKVNDALRTGPFAGCDAAVDGEGHFIIVFSGGPIGNTHVYAQWYMANGKLLGGNVRVDDGPDGHINGMGVAAACDSGTSVVAWMDGRSGAKTKIGIQCFNRDGTKRGTNILIAGTPDSVQMSPAVGMDAKGNFVVLWQEGALRPRVLARRFGTDGRPADATFRVAPPEGDAITKSFGSAVAVLPDGRFTAYWMTIAVGGEVIGQARQFDASGEALTDVFRVDEAGKFAYIGDLSVAAHPPSGLTAFAWAGNESDDWDIYARFRIASGAFPLPSAPVNDRPGIQNRPDVAIDNVENTLYAWRDNRNGNYDVYAMGITPKRPNYVTAGSGYDGMVPLTWEPWFAQSARTQYRILRTESLSQAPTVIATVDPSARPYPDRMLDFIDHTAENGHTYYYGVENVVAGSSGPYYTTATSSEPGHVIRSAWCGVEPSLDGMLSPGEWEDAARVRLENPDAMHGVWLYVKNTGGVLYAAVDDSNDMALEPATSFSLFFDLDHNGKWDDASPSGEGAITLTQTAAAFQGCWGLYPNGIHLDAAGTAAGIRRTFSAASGHVQYEVGIDLAASPVRAAAGSTIGAGFRVWDPGNFYGYHYANAGEWPEGSLWEAAETLGDLILTAEGGSTSTTFLVTNTQDTGPWSLRQAIEDVNAGEGPCRVQFHIPVTDPGYDASTGTWTIHANSSMLGINQRETLIDGTSQAAFIGSDTNPLGPEIALDGSGAGNTSGLVVNGSCSEIRHLAVFGFQLNQIHVYCDCCKVTGCYIGTDVSGLHSTLKGGGIYIDGNGNTIGGTAETDRNVISGLKFSAVDIVTSCDNRILGNYIGINASGADTLGNAWGVRISDRSLHNVIGPGNVISGNRNVGIWFNNDSDSNSIIGNRIGTDPAGGRGWGNEGDGIRIVTGCSVNFIGGSSEAERNVISGNGSPGISLYGAGTDSNVVTGNFVGTSADGSAAIPNEWTGISISNGASRNRIGGESPGEGNLISGNVSCGIWVRDAGTNENQIAGNFIGTGGGGVNPLGNEDEGIQISSGPQNNRIGPGNRISYNGRAGIAIRNSETVGNRITQNSIHDNGEAGISLGDGNDDAQAPSLTAVSPVAGTAEPGAEVEIFMGPDDEGMDYLATVTADGSGNFTWTGTVSGRYVTATATDAEGNTSEFSASLETGSGIGPERVVPKEFSLAQNHPNPFNPSTEIRFDVRESCRVVLKVIDLLGREIATVADGRYGAGRYTVRFDASGLASGIYIYRIESEAFKAARKMTVLE